MVPPTLIYHDTFLRLSENETTLCPTTLTRNKLLTASWKFSHKRTKHVEKFKKLAQLKVITHQLHNRANKSVSKANMPKES